MKHVILFSYILFFSSGFAALAALIYFRLELSDKILSPLLALHAVFLLTISTVMNYYYLQQIIELSGNSPIDPKLFFGIISSILNALLLLLVCDLLRRLVLDTRALRALRVSVYAGAISAILLIVIKSAGAAAGIGILRTSMLYSLSVYVIITASVGIMGWILISAHREHQDVVGWMLRMTGYCSLVFVPLSIIEFLLATTGNNVYKPLSLDTLYFFGVSIVFIIAFIRYITTGKHEFSDQIQEYSSSLGLTPRQMEMLTLIEQGHSNKEIAYRMRISAATVRTHIYNLYQKAGVQSRTELVHRLHSYDKRRS
jgi:DNA-binding CsgD family transcriptional regulator